MGKSWLLCALMGTMAWGQAPATPPPAPAKSAAVAPAGDQDEAAKPPAPPKEVAENAVVLTIVGVCPAAPKTATAATKTATGKTAAAPAKKPAECKTEITRAEFEKIAKGLAPTVTPQLKRQLATALPRFMAMSEAAKTKGLDKTPQYEQTVKIAKMQILTTELQRSVQEEAEKIPPAEVDTYYKKNPEAYEQFSLDRLFIPRYKQVEPDDKDEAKDSDKMTEEQQKAKEEADKAKQEQSEKDLSALADTLHERAAKGEDFTKLQKEAFEASGTKVDNPTINLPKVRRTGLPPAHVAVFDLKVGEVSAVISDNGGHYIYKVVSKEVLPLEQVKEEIHNKLKSEHIKAAMDKYQNSYHAETNEAYFGPASAAVPPPPHMRGRMPGPPMQQGPPQGTPSPAGAPPTKPN